LEGGVDGNWTTINGFIRSRYLLLRRETMSRIWGGRLGGQKKKNGKKSVGVVVCMSSWDPGFHSSGKENHLRVGQRVPRSLDPKRASEGHALHGGKGGTILGLGMFYKVLGSHTKWI